MPGVYKANAHFEEELAADVDVQAFLAGKAQEALGAAQSIANSFRKTGAYERSLYAEENVLGTTDSAAFLIEFGSVNNPPYAPLRKAAEQVGAKVVVTSA